MCLSPTAMGISAIVTTRNGMSTVLVTGGSGFVGSHAIVQLLQAGYQVRTTVRNLSRAPDVRAMLREGGVSDAAPVSILAADLERDAGWLEALQGCDYVLHVASPFPGAEPRHEDDLIVPAREGTLRVLRAARDARVRRVVMTSSFGAIGYGHAGQKTAFDETDWTDPDAADVQPYIKSKTLAERAAWDFIAREGGGLELAVINPVGIFGPVLGPDYSSSIALVRSLLDGAMPATPRISFGAVDVRDVADLHIRAMTSPNARGERFLAVAGPAISLHQAAEILHARLGAAARRVPRRELPDWLARLAARFAPSMRGMVSQLGIVRNASNAKAKAVLGWTPRTTDDAIAASGESLIRLALLKR
jgi:nucleoside-diphosphate-sugar epimerase